MSTIDHWGKYGAFTHPCELTQQHPDNFIVALRGPQDPMSAPGKCNGAEPLVPFLVLGEESTAHLGVMSTGHAMPG